MEKQAQIKSPNLNRDARSNFGAKGWWIVFYSFICFYLYGACTNSSLNTVIPMQSAKFGWDAASLLSWSTPAGLIALVVCLFFGRMVAKKGLVRTQIVILVLAGLSMIWWGSVSTFNGYVISLIVMVCLMNAIQLVGGNMLITNWFPKKKGIAIGWATMGLNISSATVVIILMFLVGILGGIKGALIAFGTVKAAHANNAEIWLIPSQDDIFFTGLAKSGTLKLLPYFGAAMLAEGDAAARTYTLTNKALTPFAVGRIEAVRLSADVTINWWPRDVDPYGAGVKSEAYSDQTPFIYSGDFMYRIGTSGDYTAVSATSLRLSRAGAFTVYIMARQNGALSSAKSLTVAAADGTYTI